MNGQQPGTIVAENDREYPADFYTESNRKTGTQRWVANEWAKGSLPTHNTSGSACVLTSSTGNFRGLQYPSGKGKLKHYRTIEGIRTIEGLFISNTECYARGWAHCTTPSLSVVPSANRASLPLTTMDARQRKATVPDMYHIINVVRLNDSYNGFDRVVEYDTGQFVFASGDRVEGLEDPFDEHDADDLLRETNTDHDF